MTVSTLCFEEEIVARCESGRFRAELTLFLPIPAPGNKVEGATFPLATTAGQARTRLEAVGIGRALIHDTQAALRPDVIAAFARGPTLRKKMGVKLGLADLFAGGTYDPASQTYEGRWLDMQALSGAIGVRGAGYALQVIHLAAYLGELRPEVPVSLAVSDAAPPPSSRRIAPLRFPEARRLPLALSSLQPGTSKAVGADAAASDERAALVRHVRDRRFGRVTDAAAERLLSVEQELARADLPTDGPLASLEAWTLHLQLEAKDGRKLDEQLAAIERRHGESPATRYLREYASFVRGLEPARRIAERLSKAVRRGAQFPEVDLLEARAWLAAGMPGYARHRAQALADTPGLSETIRAEALVILEAAPAGGHVSSHPPKDIGASRIIVVGSSPEPEASAAAAPPVVEGPRAPAHAMVLAAPTLPTFDERVTEVSESYAHVAELAPPSPRLTPLPPSADEFDRGLVTVPPPPAVPAMALAPYRPATARPRQLSIPAPVPVARPGSSPSLAPPTHGTLWKEYDEPERAIARSSPSRAPVRPPSPSWSDALGPPGGRPRRPVVAYAQPEHLETLSLPDGASEELLGAGVAPRTPIEVRIACTRMARELGRVYRKRYGIKLRADAIAVETLQRHLLTLWPDGKLEGAEALKELRRHGALLSEVLARTIGATWVDVTPSEIGYWAMFVPPGTRTWPFGRVYRFVTMGQKGRDLLSYYLELVERSRRPPDEG